MAQLGSDDDSQYPNVIDTRQVFRNGTVTLPDSDTRLDAQAINGGLSAIINIEEALGANVQGAYGSLAARLAAIEAAIEAGGGGEVPLTNVVTFTNETVVTIPSTAHQQGQSELFYAVYDASTPRNMLAPEAFVMSSAPDQAEVTFTVPHSGVFMVAALSARLRDAVYHPGHPALRGRHSWRGPWAGRPLSLCPGL